MYGLTVLISASSLLAQESGNADPVFKVYGLLKTDYVYADNAALTFGREHLLAPVSAKRQVQFDDKHPRQQIFANQSRVGASVNDPDGVTGKLEFDLVGDYSKSQPNTNVNLRTRHAYLDWAINDSLSLFGGQMWDIYAPFHPGTYNINGVLYSSGNTGWIREQFGVSLKKLGPGELSLAVGANNANNSPNPVLNYEQNESPTVALRYMISSNKALKFYVSAIASSVTMTQPLIEVDEREGDPWYWDPESDDELLQQTLYSQSYTSSNFSIPLQYRYDGPKARRREANSVSLGIDSSISDTIKLTLEGYYGRNVNNIRLLGLGSVQARSKLDKLKDTPLGYIKSEDLDIDMTDPDNFYTDALDSTTDYESINEYGGFLTIIVNITKQIEGRLIMGAAEINNKEDLGSAPLSALTMAQPNSDIWGAGQMGNPESNSTLGWSLTYKPLAKLKLYFEHNSIRTSYRDGGIITKYRYIESIDLDNSEINEVEDPILNYHTAGRVALLNTYRFGMMYSF